MGTMGEATSLRIQSLQAIFARSWFRLKHLALLTPSCGGPAPTAKRSEDPLGEISGTEQNLARWIKRRESGSIVSRRPSR